MPTGTYTNRALAEQLLNRIVVDCDPGSTNAAGVLPRPQSRIPRSIPVLENLHQLTGQFLAGSVLLFFHLL